MSVSRTLRRSRTAQHLSLMGSFRSLAARGTNGRSWWRNRSLSPDQRRKTRLPRSVAGHRLLSRQTENSHDASLQDITAHACAFLRTVEYQMTGSNCLQHFLQHRLRGSGKALEINREFQTTRSIHHGRNRHAPRYDIVRFSFHVECLHSLSGVDQKAISSDPCRFAPIFDLVKTNVVAQNECCIAVPFAVFSPAAASSASARTYFIENGRSSVRRYGWDFVGCTKANYSSELAGPVSDVTARQVFRFRHDAGRFDRDAHKMDSYRLEKDDPMVFGIMGPCLVTRRLSVGLAKIPVFRRCCR